jgi:membrane protease YdiL (CAAX protease family)
MKAAIEKLYPLSVLAFGALVLFSSSKVSSIVKIPNPFLLLILFILFNVLVAIRCKLVESTIEIYSFKKSPQLFIGLFWGCLMFAPFFVAYFTKDLVPKKFEEINLVKSAFGTLCVVAWEELWFRGVPLMYGARKYTKFGSAIIFGLMFMLLHALNPEVSLLTNGLYLFIAGYSLSLLFFISESMWAPIGMHFANNYLELLVGKGFFNYSWDPSMTLLTMTELVVAIILTFQFYRKNNNSFTS